MFQKVVKYIFILTFICFFQISKSQSVKFDKVEWFCDDFLLTRVNDKYGVISEKDSLEILPNKYLDIQSFYAGIEKSNFNFFITENNLDWSLYDPILKMERFRIKAKKILIDTQLYQTNFLCIIQKEDGKYNLINSNGNLILKKSYDDLSICYVYYQYYKITENGKKGMIDNNGLIILPIIYDNIKFIDYPEKPKIILEINGKKKKYKLNKLKKKFFDLNKPFLKDYR